ncbi:voltage-dependent potassium channel beta subunit, animal [Paenibacillus polysaccharolyticus]|uniref:Voltage-dependent potassium channel beta subunit, animal n=1 Tax=Paenibacillus polysaccharolyticus TaxID=582692 RepID=A0A1G5D630_9BACL|nr:aldo/keto reductase family protein [Paenibacillus polysaccharolyticus]SCY10135.1 voltage-dependent potassium channel beta subunit, animal [Paenibacillus polysaccharolyticus]
MKYRKLGRSGLKVSEIGLGSWLTYGSATSEEAARACMHKAYELGVNFFDTSNSYTGAEEVMGSTLKSYSRSSYVLATKLFFPQGSGPNERGLSRKHIVEQCEASLKRLGTDYIDLYQCHRFDSETPVEETLRALDDLQAQGKILYAGVSEWTAAQIAEASGISKRLNLRPLISNQPIYNMFERYIEREGVIEQCEQEGLGLIVFSPLAQGILTGKYKPGQQIPEGTRAANNQTNGVINSYLREDVLQCTVQLSEMANELGTTLSQFALAWILRQPAVSSAIIGSSRPVQIEENLKAIELKLTPDIISETEKILSSISHFAPMR